MHPLRKAVICGLIFLPRMQGSIIVSTNEATVEFPQAVRFRIVASSGSPIESLHLEFGTDELACQETIQRAVPEDFEPGTDVDIEWSWNLRRTGSLPPGTQIWWRWLLEDSDGNAITTERRLLTFIDDTFAWRTSLGDQIRLHNYQGSSDFISQLKGAGEDSLRWMQAQYGIGPSAPVDIYIYANQDEMQGSTLFAPAWSGGLAFPTASTVIIAIGEDQLAWGIDAVAHELSHVVVGQFTLSCVNSTPPWIDEGLAMYAEESVRPHHAELLSAAIESNELHSVRELGFAFSAVPDLAGLAYAQSRSLVQYLLENHGTPRMISLLEQFRTGASEDTALRAVYAMDRDQLEVAWREWVGAPPSERIEELAATPTRTVVPTLRPITAGTSQPEATATQPAAPPSPTEDPSDSFCAILALVPVGPLMRFVVSPNVKAARKKRKQ